MFYHSLLALTVKVYHSLLALTVKVITGLGAVISRDLIGRSHNVLFLGQVEFYEDARLFTPPSPWGPSGVLIPVFGAVAVTFWCPEAKGHGVPEVMDAIYYGGGIIRPVVAVVKSLASAIAIAIGAAVGREGPIIQISSALGSTLGQMVRILPAERNIFVASGASAGIAATFNTPIGGVMFAIELMLPEVSARLSSTGNRHRRRHLHRAPLPRPGASLHGAGTSARSAPT
jgi:CIC family chloride channel protein